MTIQLWSILLVTVLIGFCVALALVLWVRTTAAPQRDEVSRGRTGASPGSLTRESVRASVFGPE